MDLSQNRCPICGGLSFVWDDEGIYGELHYNWHHVCKNNIRIRGTGTFHTEEEAWLEWAKYCEIIENEMDFELVHGFRKGYDEGVKDIKRKLEELWPEKNTTE